MDLAMCMWLSELKTSGRTMYAEGSRKTAGHRNVPSERSTALKA